MASHAATAIANVVPSSRNQQLLQRARKKDDSRERITRYFAVIFQKEADASEVPLQLAAASSSSFGSPIFVPHAHPGLQAHRQ
jgi:hypothetical protein